MIELLVSTMKQTNILKLVQDMNIRTNAIIINQIAKYEYKEFDYTGKKIKCYSFNEVGVGSSRNNALLRSEAEICILADDDISYYDDYAEQIIAQYEKYIDADVLIFNLDEKSSQRYKIDKPMRINWMNYTKFGAARISFRRTSILKKRIAFSTLFGGGATYSAGEDTLFIHDCLKNGLKIIAVPVTIGLLKPSVSTWFTGYNKKLLMDTGACYSELFGIQYYPRVLLFVVKNKKKYMEDGIGMLQAFRLIMSGKKMYKSQL